MMAEIRKIVVGTCCFAGFAAMQLDIWTDFDNPSQIELDPPVGRVFQITFSLSLLGVRGRSMALSCSTDAQLYNGTLGLLWNPVA